MFARYPVLPPPVSVASLVTVVIWRASVKASSATALPVSVLIVLVGSIWMTGSEALIADRLGRDLFSQSRFWRRIRSSRGGVPTTEGPAVGRLRASSQLSEQLLDVGPSPASAGRIVGAHERREGQW